MFGRELRTKINAVVPEHKSEWPSTSQRSPIFHDNTRSFEVGDVVCARNFTSDPTWMKGVITSRMGRFKYEIELSNGRKITRHVDALKRFHRRIDGIEAEAKALPKEADVGVPTSPREMEGSLNVRSVGKQNDAIVECSLPVSSSAAQPSPEPSRAPHVRRNPTRHCGKPKRYGTDDH